MPFSRNLTLLHQIDVSRVDKTFSWKAKKWQAADNGSIHITTYGSSGHRQESLLITKPGIAPEHCSDYIYSSNISQPRLLK